MNHLCVVGYIMDVGRGKADGKEEGSIMWMRGVGPLQILPDAGWRAIHQETNLWNAILSIRPMNGLQQLIGWTMKKATHCCHFALVGCDCGLVVELARFGVALDPQLTLVRALLKAELDDVVGRDGSLDADDLCFLEGRAAKGLMTTQKACVKVVLVGMVALGADGSDVRHG
jgi:hypothetical protein